MEKQKYFSINGVSIMPHLKPTWHMVFDVSVCSLVRRLLLMLYLHYYNQESHLDKTIILHVEEYRAISCYLLWKIVTSHTYLMLSYLILILHLVETLKSFKYQANTVADILIKLAKCMQITRFKMLSIYCYVEYIT